MMALSLWQPWASLVAAGLKRVETRSWPTTYRGPLAIHATLAAADVLQLPPELRAAAERALGGALVELPRGGIVAIAQLEDVVATDRYRPTPEEAPWGDYRPGRFAWILRHVRSISPSYPARGHQRLWPLEDGLARTLEHRALAVPALERP